MQAKFEHVRLEDLKVYERNARTHSPEQVQQLVNSIREFGFTNPVLVDEDNVLIAGHGRTAAATELGMDRVPAIRLAGLSEAQKKALRIADNQLALNSGWDMDLLASEIAELQDDDFDLGLLGFDSKFLDELLDGTLLEDEEPEAGADGEGDGSAGVGEPGEYVSQAGDVWLLGQHRVMCGDSTSLDDVEKLMGGVQADMVWTDPPYNVAYEGGTEEALTIQNDDMPDEDFRQFLRDVFTSAYAVTVAGGPIYIAHADSEGLNFRAAMIESGWLYKQCLIWVKNTFVMGRQDHHWQHEPILYGWKPGAAHFWYGDRNKSTVIDDDVDVKALGKPELIRLVNELRNQLATTIYREAKPVSSRLHPTMKPVALVAHQIQNSSQRGDVVLDLFGGSGTTLMACNKTGRINRSMELDPRYCDAIVQRWQSQTGKRAVLEETGKTFDEMKAERLGCDA